VSHVPVPTPSDDSTERWAREAALAAHDKQGTDTVVFRVGEVLAVADLFVVTSAPNTRQVRAISEEVEHRVATLGGPKPRRVEGLDDLRWVLLDYGDFVVHVFLDETRRYYDLERLWSDAPRLAWSGEVTP
jgi:ribosome-associated protein